jgi:hypothetical protein
MTTPAPSQPASPPSQSSQTPTGVRIASTLCWVVGVFTILAAIAIGIPAISSGAGLLFIGVNVLAGAIVCVAAVQIRRQRKVGVLLMLVAWAIPTLVALVQHLPVRGSLLLFVALLFAGANWKHFR